MGFLPVGRSRACLNVSNNSPPRRGRCIPVQKLLVIGKDFPSRLDNPNLFDALSIHGYNQDVGTYLCVVIDVRWQRFGFDGLSFVLDLQLSVICPLLKAWTRS